MALIDYKVTDGALVAGGVVSLPDKPSEAGMSAEALKMAFDNLSKNVIGDSYNSLIDALTALNADIMVGSNDIRLIRLNEDGAIETSADGVLWITSTSGGHIIYDKYGSSYPQRSRMKFMGETVVTDDGTYTIISGVKGDKGEKGERGDQGIQGPEGKQGERGVVIVPSVNADGVISWTEQDVANLPLPMSIRGPQGPQGVQGAQGSMGAQGLQGIQGVQGPQGIKGDKGDKGDKGAQGIQGIQGPQGPQGIQGLPGADGRSFVIQDVYPTLGELKNALPIGNEYAYQVSADKNIYIWSENESNWVSLGQLQGPQGPQGIQGVQGVQGEVGPQGEKGDTGAQGPQGIQGETGPQGVQGIQGIPGTNGKSAYESAVSAGYNGTETIFNASLANVPTHINNDVVHITEVERTKWNAKAETGDIPTNVSQLTNDSNYATTNYVDQKVANIPTPDVSGQISAHNVSSSAHSGMFAPAYTYGTSDLTAGTSKLETGKLYFVYE